MAGVNERNVFCEKISPFLAERLEYCKRTYGENSQEYMALSLQYVTREREREADVKSERRRHYEAEVGRRAEDGVKLKGVERMYRRLCVFDLTMACAAHCRWCARAQYPNFTLTREEITEAAKYFGDDRNRDDLREVLITGGDPLIAPERLKFALDEIERNAPNIRIVRIGSRIPVQQPSLVSEHVLCILRKRSAFRIELGTQVNHAVELAPASVEAYQKLLDLGIRVYNQQVLLRGVNDDIGTLIDLYDGLRYAGIESHYMFHCVPIRGMSHHRTTVEKGLELIKSLTVSGRISGRAKPIYIVMTDVGKVTMYEGTVVDRKADMILLRTNYAKSDRLRWNPNWVMPGSAEEDECGFLRVWYKDAVVHNEGWQSTYFLSGK